jgi:hypothetical protein
MNEEKTDKMDGVYISVRSKWHLFTKNICPKNKQPPKTTTKKTNNKQPPWHQKQYSGERNDNFFSFFFERVEEIVWFVKKKEKKERKKEKKKKDRGESHSVQQQKLSRRSAFTDVRKQNWPATRVQMASQPHPSPAP